MLQRLIMLIFTLLLAACQSTTPYKLPSVLPELSSDTHESATQTWPVLSPLAPPQGLRACCAFGYDLHAQLWGIPVPFYTIDNIVEADKLGEHHYNDSFFGATAALMGVSKEKVGLLYSEKGGFIDISHVRDTADYTLFLFSQIYPKLGEGWTLKLSDELASRQIVFHSFAPPTSAQERYTLSAYLAAKLAFQLAAWHEIAQWYGYQSVPGFSEGISAFSPEDLYSNLLGARLAMTLILQGRAQSLPMFSQSLENTLPIALEQLGANSKSQTRKMFDRVDGLWWNSYQRVPEKFLVLTRDYDTSDNRYPLIPLQMIPTEHLRLSLPNEYRGYVLHQLAQLRLLPTKKMAQLPIPQTYWTVADFPALSTKAQKQDQQQQRLSF
ncbi:DUF4056 domain-containing protein [Providencia stuartii]|uniref:DUF4056 domain-containing protein n=1 Tax=Providencia stuartii TaxID=588 RepID=UPI00076B5D80|nr:MULTISPECIES: DUF4056 domain-containing protein [Providencia]AMG68111.1 DUF4056 domain-containing protein [Providencia stuartii]EMD1718369.1 DUF4056 domain-containing protein [Providencia stuartii]MBG5908652.1 DUF4056 domain-containing protein [Providencia stuartii]MDT2042070.1 DUF4056 domain-containing protein [Providencia stuartii]MTC10999.1 DUF4056 domain-containing protein [Providencia stuartii]